MQGELSFTLLGPALSHVLAQIMRSEVNMMEHETLSMRERIKV